MHIVFYITSVDYWCYALINVHRLIFHLKSDPEIDVVLLAIEPSRIQSLCPDFECPFPKNKVKTKIISIDVVQRYQRSADNVFLHYIYFT
jgi:hypothetical protein